MGKWVIGLCAAGVLVAAAAASSQVVLAPTVYHSAALPSNSTTTFTVTCPRGYVAVSAGVSNPAPGVTTLSIRPAGTRAFVFRFGNPSTNPARRVTVAVACRKLRAAKGAYLKVVRVKTQPVSVHAQAQKQVLLACPRGTIPAGAGLDLGDSSLNLHRQTGTLSRFTFSVRNDGSSARSAVLYGACLTVVRLRGSGVGSLRVSLQTQTTPISSGTHVIKWSCPSGWVSLATGFDLPAALTLRGSAAVGHGGKWTVTNAGDAEVLADLQLACGRLT